MGDAWRNYYRTRVVSNPLLTKMQSFGVKVDTKQCMDGFFQSVTYVLLFETP